jgi:hypothetical protein
MGCKQCTGINILGYEKFPKSENNELINKTNLNYLSLKIEENIQNESQKKTFKENNNKNYYLSNHSSDFTNPATANNIQNLNYEFSNQLEELRIQMIIEINNIRNNPQSLIPKIEKYKNKISNYGKHFFINIDQNNKLKLSKGKSVFESCQSYLEKKKPLSSLFLKNELTFPFPEYEQNNIEMKLEDCINESYLTPTLTKIKNDLLKYNIQVNNFHYDIMNSNIELSVLLQIVDDTNSMFQRRKNIFGKNIKYIGLNIGKIENGLYCYYLLFGKDKI